mmetsp:Transcript_492/g.1840  ORF Transcript_492/g.1840 Transcript_492/m.1840 type:complete len:239 (-) Transcript_492:1100-1816(-)
MDAVGVIKRLMHSGLTSVTTANVDRSRQVCSQTCVRACHSMCDRFALEVCRHHAALGSVMLGGSSIAKIHVVSDEWVCLYRAPRDSSTQSRCDMDLILLRLLHSGASFPLWVHADQIPSRPSPKQESHLPAAHHQSLVLSSKDVQGVDSSDCCAIFLRMPCRPQTLFEKVSIGVVWLLFWFQLSAGLSREWLLALDVENVEIILVGSSQNIISASTEIAIEFVKDAIVLVEIIQLCAQ